MNNRDLTLIIVYINVALYATCFQIQKPLEPYLVDKLVNSNGDSVQEYARLQSFFSAIQAVGSLVTGLILDRMSAKFGFYVSFLASALSYYLLSQSKTLTILYLSKLPTIFQAGFLCAQLSASQVTCDGPERVKALGRLTMAYTVGMILGPALGGWLGASGDFYFGATIAVYGSLLSVVLTYFMPDAASTSTSARSEKPKEDKQSTGGGGVLSSVWIVVSLVWLLLATKVVTSVANAMAQTTFSLVLKNTYSFSTQALGTASSAMALLNATVNGVFLGPILALLGNDLTSAVAICLAATVVLCAVQAAAASDPYLSLSPSRGLHEYLGTTVLLTVFQYVLATTITGESTARVGAGLKGTLLGLEHSLFALARVVAPQTGVGLLQRGGVSLVSAACAAVFASVLSSWFVFRSSLAAKKPSGGGDGAGGGSADGSSERKEK